MKPCVVKACDFRSPIVIQSATVAQDSAGQAIETWSQWANGWAKIEQLSGTELVDSKQTVGDVTHRITMRYLADVTITKRIVFDGRTFGIMNVNNLEERKLWLVLLCKELV